MDLTLVTHLALKGLMLIMLTSLACWPRSTGDNWQQHQSYVITIMSCHVEELQHRIREWLLRKLLLAPNWPVNHRCFEVDINTAPVVPWILLAGFFRIIEEGCSFNKRTWRIFLVSISLVLCKATSYRNTMQVSHFSRGWGLEKHPYISPSTPGGQRVSQMSMKAIVFTLL